MLGRESGQTERLQEAVGMECPEEQQAPLVPAAAGPACVLARPSPLPSAGFFPPRLHVDMDAFFAAVEELDQPALVRGGAHAWTWVVWWAAGWYGSQRLACPNLHACPPSALSPHRPAPRLQRTCPFAVGGKAMISTANYVARKFGVRRWVGGVA